MLEYPAKIFLNKKDKIYEVEFPDLEGCFTYGGSLEIAKKFAIEALSGYLSSIDSRKIKVPRPSRLKGKNIYFIQPDYTVSFAIALKLARQESGFTQLDLANKLDVKQQTYQRWEKPGKANPNLKTINKIEKVLNRKLIQI